VLASVGDSDFLASYLTIDANVLDASQFQTFRVRFQVHNDGADPVTATPRLEYRPDGASGFVVVPEQPQLGIPFRVAREWVPDTAGSGGTKQGPLGEDIATGDFKMPSQVGKAVVGHHSMGANPDAQITLPAASYTEQEFTVRLTMDAHFSSGYEFRITDGGTALTGTDVARIVLGPQPALRLSAGQRQGVPVIDPPTTSAAGVVYPLLTAQTIATDTKVAAVVPASGPANAVLYPLASGSLSPAVAATSTSTTVGVPIPSTDGSAGIHSDCAACHRGHTAQAPNLLAQSQQSILCLSCHDASGALQGAKDVKSQYTLVVRPPNDSVKREYYSHDALAPTTPSEAGNRQSECSDCHNSHRAKATPDSTQALPGAAWDASGSLAGVSGVAVVNNAADAAPTYTFLDGVTKPVTLEYQLCFKCHSGFTQLLPKIPGKPSTDALDKAAEFNPANASFHPVEAAGTNQTTKMTDSLAGTSPYKLWNFNTGSTIRCLNCHASGTTPDITPTPLPQPGSALAPHTSSNRGILLKNYLDRELKPGVDTGTAKAKAAYSAGDFALCYVCHGEEPFANATTPGASTATNFSLHGQHLNLLAGKGSGGTDIDKAGAGQGNAICAECHFRIHSTTDKVGTQAISGSRLVNFAPNVQPVVPGGTVSWTAPGTTSGGSCTLTCHGYEHKAAGY